MSRGGDVIIVPKGATGSLPVDNGKGFQYSGGSDGRGLDRRVANVRIMDATAPKGRSPGYPNGYVNYTNNQGPGQTINPYNGQPISRSDFWWHIPLSPTKP